MKYTKEEKAEALATLRKLCPPGTTVYTKLNHVSRSGMSRSITPFLIRDGEPYYIAYSVGALFGQSRDKYDGLKIDGCGMDMGFDLVYRLSRILYPDGFGIEGKGPYGHRNRPDTKEKATLLVSKGYKFHGRNGDTSGWDDNGGYSLDQRWI